MSYEIQRVTFIIIGVVLIVVIISLLSAILTIRCSIKEKLLYSSIVLLLLGSISVANLNAIITLSRTIG